MICVRVCQQDRIERRKIGKRDTWLGYSGKEPSQSIIEIGVG
jgi:hypothetical protein